MRIISGLLIGILFLLLVLPVPVFAGDFSGPASGITDQGISAFSPVMAATTTPMPTLAKISYIAVTPASAPKPGGVLSIGSVPAGASVSVDGIPKGTTPLTVSPITVGVHTVSFQMAGFADYSATVTITAGSGAKLVGTLTPLTSEKVTSTVSPSATVTTQVPVTRRTTIPGTTVPSTLMRTLQQVTGKQTGKCMRQYFGSGQIATTPDGRLNCTTIISTEDQIATLTLQEGTLVTDAAKKPVTEIRITPVISGEIASGTGPDGSRWTGRAYHFLPDHASFDPPVLVSFTLSRDEWNRSDPANLSIRETSGTGTGWEPLATGTDPVTRTLSAPAQHFSVIGLFSTNPTAVLPVSRQSPLDLIRTATGSSRGPLPLSPLIPDMYAPLAAVAAGVALSIAGAMAGGSSAVSQWWSRITDLIRQFLGSETIGLMNATEIEKRSMRPAENLSAVLLGLSSREMLVIGISALGFAAAFILQDRLRLDLTTIIIFVCAGGIATILHDLAHKYCAYRIGCVTEFQFWSLGMVTMLATAWLFGNAFAKPSRTLIRSKKPLPEADAAVIRLAGPLMSMAVAVVSLLMIPLGGLFVIAGSAGFSINLLNSVFSLVPVRPNDGMEVWAWNKPVWALVFVPLIAFYLSIYLLL